MANATRDPNRGRNLALGLLFAAIVVIVAIFALPTWALYHRYDGELAERSAFLVDLVPDMARGDTFLHAAPLAHASGREPQPDVGFAREFDPFPFHLDEDAAKASLLGGLASSGWQTAAVTREAHESAMRASY